MTKLGSGVALESGRLRETGPSARSVRRRFSVNSRSGKTKGGFALSGESHDIYEKAGTYKRFGRFARDHMLLIINYLQRNFRTGSPPQGELKVQAKATMLMKTKERQSGNLIKATMLMKTNDL